MNYPDVIAIPDYMLEKERPVFKQFGVWFNPLSVWTKPV